MLLLKHNSVSLWLTNDFDKYYVHLEHIYMLLKSTYNFNNHYVTLRT